MNYQVILNNGQTITLTNAEFNAEALTQTLNSREITFVNIGNSVVNKNLIGTITPIVEVTE